MPPRHLRKGAINTESKNELKTIEPTLPTITNATSCPHHLKCKRVPSSHTPLIMATASTTTAINSDSSHETRNGYRLQRHAYERKAHQTQPLSSIISNRRSQNEYVDRLKRFYDVNTITTSEASSASHGKNVTSDRVIPTAKTTTTTTTTTPAKHNSQIRHNHPVEIKSVLRLPDVKTSSALGKSNNSRVKIMLPIEASSANGRLVVCAPSAAKIPAPPVVPVQLANVTSYHGGGGGGGHREGGKEDYLSSSLTSTMASSILEAVGELRKKSPPKKSSSQSYRPQHHSRRRFTNGHVDPKSLAMKMSLPCRIGCCYCVYSSLLGPVKVFMTRGQKPKQGPWLAGIRDGHGRLVIPVSRKSDVTGLVYDAHSHSLHPPAKGQRPMYLSSKGHERDKSESSTVKKSIKGNNKKETIKKRS